MGTPANIVFGNATVDIGGDLGYVKGDGIVVQKNEEIYKPVIEGLLSAPIAHRTAIEYSVQVTLVEPTTANLIIGWDILDALTPYNVGEVNTNDEHVPTERALTITGAAPGGSGVRTIAFDKAIVEGPGEVKFTQFEEQSIPLVFVGLWDDTADRVFVLTDS